MFEIIIVQIKNK